MQAVAGLAAAAMPQAVGQNNEVVLRVQQLAGAKKELLRKSRKEKLARFLRCRGR